MATISELSGDERKQRIAELKRKMQEAAQKAKAEHAEQEDAPSEPAESAPVAAASAATEAVTQESGGEARVTPAAAEAVAVVEEATDEAVESAGEIVEEAAPPAPPQVMTGGNGATAAAAAIPAALAEPEEDPEAKLRSEMNRREFITYAWGAALGLLALETGALSFFFMYPRFRAGEFGGNFFSSDFYGSELPPTDAAPVGIANGKFWWLNTADEGPKAIYMVCTHLGCLYKWVGERNRFECPCHGSKFTREGYFIEGPAPRSLDTFETTEENGQYVVNTGSRIPGGSAAESPFAGTG